jgi:hypothetical protein
MPAAPYPDLPDDRLQALQLLQQAFGDVQVLVVEPKLEPWDQPPLEDDEGEPEQ